MRTKLIILLVLVLINLIYSVLLHLNPDKETSFNYLFNTSYTLVFLLGAAFAFFAFKVNTFKTGFGRGMFFYAISLLSYSVGLLIWAFYNLVLQQPVPYPGLSDIFFILFMPAAFLGFIFVVRDFGGKFSLSSIFEFLILFGIIFAMLYSFLSLSSLGSELPILERILNILYPLLDAMMIALAIVGLRTEKGRLHLNLLIFVFASLTMAFADITFSFRSAQGLYWNGDIADVLYLLSGGMFSFGVISLSSQNNPSTSS